MQTAFELESFDPIPLRNYGVLDNGAGDGNALMALDTVAKYLFVDETGAPFHEYLLPASDDVQRLGGYIDKLIKWRDPKLFKYLSKEGISVIIDETLGSSILNTRSPIIDYYLYYIIKKLREHDELKKIRLFDLGCTVAEHFDFLDLLIRADSIDDVSANDLISYVGLDSSPSALLAAQMFHNELIGPDFELLLSEGAQHDFPPQSFDLSLTVGVVNHLSDPMRGLEKLFSLTRHACVLALWVTKEDEGRWVQSHGGLATYFFSRSDLLRMREVMPEGRYLYSHFIPDVDTTNPKGYVGVGEEVIAKLGCYHLIYTNMELADHEFSALHELKL